MYKFIKYCKDEHNIAKGCLTLQLGTLQYYRELDKSFTIADPDEGIFSAIVRDYDPSKTPDKKMSKFIPINAIIRNIEIRHTFPNSYIFCISQETKKDPSEIAKSFSPTYNSYYKILDIDKFAVKIANLLLENITLSNFTKETKNNLTGFTLNEFKEIGVNLQKRFVTYCDSKDEIVTESKFYKDSENLDPNSRILFTKGSKFQEEREYRIVLSLFHPTIGYLSVNKTPILLPVNVFARTIETEGI